MTVGARSLLYVRNGRYVSSRPWHQRLTELSDRFQARRDAASSAGKLRLDALYHRACSLTPRHFSYTPSLAERNWEKYLAAEDEL